MRAAIGLAGSRRGCLLGASLAGALLFVGLRLATPSDGGRVAFYEDAWTTAGVLISPIDRRSRTW